MKIVIAGIAQQEFNDAKEFYEISKSGLGMLLRWMLLSFAQPISENARKQSEILITPTSLIKKKSIGMLYCESVNIPQLGPLSGVKCAAIFFTNFPLKSFTLFKKKRLSFSPLLINIENQITG